MEVDKLMLYMPCALMINRVCHLAVIPGTIILVPYHVVKYLKLIYLKLRSHMRGAVAERRRADFDIPAPLLRVCSHIRGVDAGGSAIS